MFKSIKNNTFFMGVVYLTIAALILYAVYALSSVIIYFLISSLLYIITKPMVSKLLELEIGANKKKLPNGLIAAFIMLTLGLLVYILALQVMPLIISQSIKITQIIEHAISQESLNNTAQQIDKWLGSHGFDLNFIELSEKMISQINFGRLPQFINQLIGALSGMGAALFAITFITFFLLKEPKLFANLVKKHAQDSFYTKFHQINVKIENMLRRYLLGLGLQISLLMLYYWILLMSFDVPNAFVIAFIAGIFNIVPYIGPIFGASSIFFLGLSSLMNVESQADILVHLATIGKVLIGFLVIQLLDAMISQPLIYSNSVKAHPLEVFLVILSAGTLAGPLGMIIAVPTYTILRIVVKEVVKYYRPTSLNQNI